MRRFRVWVLPRREVLERAADALLTGSTLNGHPRFFGYITSSASPIGALADMLAASLNANCGAWALSPVATEIERQTIRWVAELIGFPTDSGGILVSGGNVANLVCFMAATRDRAQADLRTHGVHSAERMLVYASAEVHTWLEKTADICGLGLDAVRPVPVDGALAMRTTPSASRSRGTVAMVFVRPSSSERRGRSALGRSIRCASCRRSPRKTISGSTWTARTARRRRC